MSSPGFQSDSAAMTRAVQGFEETANNARQTMNSLEQELTSTLAQYQSYPNSGSGDAETHQSFNTVANQASAGGAVLSRLVGGSAH